MADITYMTVTGLWSHVVDDGIVDGDPNPDTVHPTGKVVFAPKPSNTGFVTAGAAGASESVTLAEVPALVAAGVLTDLQGNEGVRLAATIGGNPVRWVAQPTLMWGKKTLPSKSVTFDPPTVGTTLHLNDLFDDVGPQSPLVTTEVKAYRDQAVAARDAAQQILDDAALGVVPDAGVAARIADPDSETRTALDTTYAPAALNTQAVKTVNGVAPTAGNVNVSADVDPEVVADAITADLATRDLIEAGDSRVPEIMTTADDWLEVHTDADGKVLYGVRSDGTFEDFREGIPEVLSWASEEWAYVITDADDKIIAGWRTDGTVYPEPAAPTPYTPPIPITSVWPAVQRGDSTSRGSNVAAGEDWGSKLAVLTGQTITNMGSSGQRAEEIAAQMGGITFTATVTGNSIPASGAVALTNLELNPVRGGEISSYTVKIAGVVGTLARGANDSTVNFTRTTAGSAVTVPAVVDVESVSGPALNHRIHFIAFGVNNEPLITAGSPTQRVEDIMAWYKACTSVLTPARPRFVVWGMLDRGASEGVGTTIGILIRKVEDYLAQQYGSDFVPIRRLLASYRALAIAGITPTSTDDTDIAAGAIPDSLRDAGSVHLNAAGMTVQAHFMYQHLLRKGWI
ncbi:hypothetical protein SEA_WOCKET_32 [Gordonia phage Wocket]|nr:hypothetical protein SEA_WOCKET_32 [Gordonia phage Wocket]